MNEKMNQTIENTLKGLYVEALRRFNEKTYRSLAGEIEKEVEPGKEVCRKIFWETNRDEEEMDLICEWDIVSSKAKSDAVKIVFGI